MKPTILNPGNRIAIVAPAGKVNKGKVMAGKELLESWGLEVQLAKHVFDHFHRFAATDEQRLGDLQQAMDDPMVKAIFCARGGYGCSRILDKLDWNRFGQHPKWVIGFSDITALLGELQQRNFPCIHGPMAAQISQSGGEEAAEYFRELLFGHPVHVTSKPHAFNCMGQAEAPLTGGNLSILCHLLGTPSAVNTAGKILFIEEISEYLYTTDRMMVQLKRAGVLKDLAGLIVGQMSDMKDDEDSFGNSAYDIIREHTAEYNYPVAFGFPAGHEAENYALPFGLPVRFTVGPEGGKLEVKL